MPATTVLWAQQMFTGIVEQTGVLKVSGPHGPSYRLAVTTELGELVAGESIAVNGACLTVAHITRDGFTADVSPETVRATTLGTLRVGARLNLERALRLNDRLGGHLVTGHVDGIAGVERIEDTGASRKVTFNAPDHVTPLLAPKGSVALDGVSLTVNSVQGCRFDIMLVPFTLRHTTLSQLSPGRELNIEADLLARYVVRALGAQSLMGKPLERQAQDDERDQALMQALRRANMA